jgi:hypothetical protein
VNLTQERIFFATIRSIVGEEIFSFLDKKRKIALLELIKLVSIDPDLRRYGIKPDCDVNTIYRFFNKKIDEIEKQEMLALLKREFCQLPTINLRNYPITKIIFNKLLYKMDELIKKIELIEFEHPELKKRKSDILDAVNRRVSIPSDDLDLYVLNHVMPGILEQEQVKKIEDWLKENP